jgi:hypothetical protein
MPAFQYIAWPRRSPARSIRVTARGWTSAFRAAASELGTSSIFVFPADTVPPRDITPRHGSVRLVRDDFYGRFA